MHSLEVREVIADRQLGARPVPLPIWFAPTANFNFNSLSPSPGQVITFDASPSCVLNGVIVKYEWDFGDDGQGTGKVIQHVFANSGQYQVTLTVTADNGFSGKKSKLVVVSASAP